MVDSPLLSERPSIEPRRICARRPNWIPRAPPTVAQGDLAFRDSGRVALLADLQPVRESQVRQHLANLHHQRTRCTGVDLRDRGEGQLQ